jgi:hypothetical protein
VLAACALAVAGPAIAEDETADEQLHEAFAVGLGEELAGAGTLDVRRFGRTLMLTGALGGRDDLAPLELTCMLCTVEEAQRSARSAGATLARRAGGSGSPPAPLQVPASAEPDPRPLWLPALLTGLGVAAAAAGTALLLLDGDCASTTIDAERHCSQVHDLAPAGWSLVGVGAASALTGAVLFFLFAGDEQPAGDES